MSSYSCFLFQSQMPLILLCGELARWPVTRLLQKSRWFLNHDLGRDRNRYTKNMSYIIIKTPKNILQGYHEVFDNVLFIHTDVILPYFYVLKATF